MAFDPQAHWHDAVGLEQVPLQIAPAAGSADYQHFGGDSARIVNGMRTASQAAFERLGFAPAQDICDFATALPNAGAAPGESAQKSAHTIELAQAPAPPRERGDDAKQVGNEENLIARFRKIHEEMRKRAEVIFDKQGMPAEQALLGAIKKHAITFVGEYHTEDDQPNPNREMLAGLMKNLPKGSRVAIELPDVLKPVFDRFNNSAKGSDFVIPEHLEGKYGEEALQYLRYVKEHMPDMVRGWKAARDAGLKLVPINNNSPVMRPDDPDKPAATAGKDQYMKDRLVDLYNADRSTPIVAWLGSIHGAIRGGKFGKSAAQLLNEDEQFKKNGGSVTSFHTQIAEDDGKMTLSPFCDKFKKPVSAPTRGADDEPNDLGFMSLFENPLHNIRRLADWDNVIVYPRSQPSGRPVKEPAAKAESGRSRAT